MEDFDDVRVEDKLVMLREELRMYKNTLWQLTMRHRVNKRIGAEESVLKDIESRMEMMEAGKAAVEEEIKDLTTPGWAAESYVASQQTVQKSPS